MNDSFWARVVVTGSGVGSKLVDRFEFKSERERDDWVAQYNDSHDDGTLAEKTYVYL